MNIDREAVEELIGETWKHGEWIGANVTQQMKDELRMLCAVLVSEILTPFFRELEERRRLERLRRDHSPVSLILLAQLKTVEMAAEATDAHLAAIKGER